MRHSKQHSGLQDHSVGELYPWSIVQVGDQFIQARHGVSGEQSPEFQIRHVVGIDRGLSIQHTYRQVELWVQDKLVNQDKLDGMVKWYQDKASESGRSSHDADKLANQACEDKHEKCVNAMRELSELREKRDDVVDEWKHGVKLAEFSFIVPRRNNAGEYFPISEFDAIEHKLLAAFDGFTRTDVYGKWIDDCGIATEDLSYQYSVAFKSTNANIDKLLQIVAYVKTRFDQEKIYISQDSSNVRLV